MVPCSRERGRLCGIYWLVPCKNKPCPGLNQRKTGENDPVHEPWCQLGRVRGTKGFVGGEYWEEDGDDGPSNCQRNALSGYGSFGHAANGPEVGKMGIV